MCHLKHSSISSVLPAQKVSMGLLVKFKTIQQPTILVTFFQIREYSRDYRHRGSLIFLLYLPVLFLLLLLLIAS